MKKYLSVVLKKMCNVVGANYKAIDFTKHDWYLKHEWTEKQEEEFKEWLEEFLYKNNKARKELLEIPIKNKRHIKIVVEWFMIDYGWKIKRQK